jgi:ferri-bacillibactin esterase
MKSFTPIILLSLTLLSCEQDKAPKTIFYSEKVKDSFEIYVSVPNKIDINKTYDVIYYCDANLKSGRKLRELITKIKYATKVNNTIFVGVGHIGNFHDLRRRDYILPQIRNGDTAGRSVNYGQIENFYQFLKTELIPKINSVYKTNPDNNSIFGHSLGGLFVFYCLFKNENLFENYYALSPALWIDNYSIYNFNKLTKENMIKRNLYFSTGGFEIMNHIKKGTNRMENFLNAKKYENLNYKYVIHKGQTHNSQVEKSIDYILKQN